MKKAITVSNLVRCLGIILGLTAFGLMFGNQLYYSAFGGKGYVSFNNAMFVDGGAILTFIGYLAIGVASLCACCLLIANVKVSRKLIDLVLAAVLVAGAVFVFLESTIYNNNSFASVYHLAACPIIAGAYAIAAALLIVASDFAPNKKLLK